MISDVFHRLKFMERRGSGLKKIIKEYESENLPEFYSDQQYFTVTLMNKNYGEAETTEKTTKKTENRILTLLINNPGITQKEISMQLGDITIDGVRYNMKKLKNKGIIRRVGPDKGGYWEIDDDFKKNE